jgi:hypothetical protein
MKHYDPLAAPDATEWLSLDETERLRLVRSYHAEARIEAPRIEVHAVIHAVVETQLAMGVPAATSACTRLLAQGLDRHETIHAIASVLAEHLNDLCAGSRGGPEPSANELNERYYKALSELTAAKWRALA